jgi:hypothetical protein
LKLLKLAPPLTTQHLWLTATRKRLVLVGKKIAAFEELLKLALEAVRFTSPAEDKVDEPEVYLAIREVPVKPVVITASTTNSFICLAIPHTFQACGGTRRWLLIDSLST